jgi:hypothetical protein
LESSTPAAVPGSPESSGLLTMKQSQVQKEEKKKQKSTRPRLLPLFARPDTGHVVFKGNEVLNQQGGWGLCFI